MLGKTLELEKGVTTEVFKEKEPEEVKIIQNIKLLKHFIELWKIIIHYIILFCIKLDRPDFIKFIN